MQPLIVILCAAITQAVTQSLPSCDHKIYCQGELLETVQMARIFQDSKTFVDLKLRYSIAEILSNFEAFINSKKPNKPSREEIRNFVNDNFEEYNEFEEWSPPDFIENPEFLSRIQDAEIKKFAESLVQIWPNLTRRVKEEVFNDPEKFSLIPVNNGFVIPGGRFKEFYYWDSYWIIRGLLLGEMYETVEGILENFLSFVERFGFIPNGSRVYYLNRSQPPLLTAMVAEYFAVTKDIKFLKKNIKIIDKELRFWLKNRVTQVVKNGRKYNVARYDVESGSPRPESYYEDVESAEYFKDRNDKIQLWMDLKSGAESGFDFTSRWIVDKNGRNTGNRTFLKTRRIIPVDLNAILCQAYKWISYFYFVLGDKENKKFWSKQALDLQIAIRDVFYDDNDGIWYDFDLKESRLRKYFYASNFAPLWANAYHPREGKILGQRAVQYLIRENIPDYRGGIPTSLLNNGEQWDFPNAWAPLQHFVVVGLDGTGNPDAKELAKEFAKRWVSANLLGFESTGLMYEKYDATNAGRYSNGGEYVVQSGFGWTNGVALDFINKYYTV